MSAVNDKEGAEVGMSVTMARSIEYAIIGLCIVAIVFVFQPFIHVLSSIGMALVVLGGLAFNLIPLCEPGRPLKDVLRAALIVIIIFIVVLILAIGAAYLYGIYLQSG
jgi:hypothetical protein